MANKMLFQNQKEEYEFTKEWNEVTASLREKGINLKVEVDVPSTEQIIGEKIESINKLLEQQKDYVKDQYNIGIYNGLVLAKSVLTGEEPKYFEMEE